MDFMDLSNEEADKVGGLPQYAFKEEETKSRFTEYSMSSSVIRRNSQLTLLDEKFEEVYMFSLQHVTNFLILCVLTVASFTIFTDVRYVQ